MALRVNRAEQYLPGLKDLKIRGRSPYLIKGRKLRRGIALAVSLHALLHLQGEMFHYTLLAPADHFNQGLARRLRWRRLGLWLCVKSGAGENREKNKDSSAKCNSKPNHDHTDQDYIHDQLRANYM